MWPFDEKRTIKQMAEDVGYKAKYGAIVAVDMAKHSLETPHLSSVGGKLYNFAYRVGTAFTHWSPEAVAKRDRKLAEHHQDRHDHKHNIYGEIRDDIISRKDERAFELSEKEHYREDYENKARQNLTVVAEQVAAYKKANSHLGKAEIATYTSGAYQQAEKANAVLKQTYEKAKQLRAEGFANYKEQRPYYIDRDTSEKLGQAERFDIARSTFEAAKKQPYTLAKRSIDGTQKQITMVWDHPDFPEDRSASKRYAPTRFEKWFRPNKMRADDAQYQLERQNHQVTTISEAIPIAGGYVEGKLKKVEHGKEASYAIVASGNVIQKAVGDVSKDAAYHQYEGGSKVAVQDGKHVDVTKKEVAPTKKRSNFSKDLAIEAKAAGSRAAEVTHGGGISSTSYALDMQRAKEAGWKL